MPLVIRMATGAGRQVAAQHSNSFEGWYAHVPGLRVLAPASVEDARGMLSVALADPDPVLMFEHAQLYNSEGELPHGAPPVVDICSARVRRDGTDVSLITHGGCLPKALRAAEELAARAMLADREKTSFLARMSHELRTPLAAVVGSLEVALKDPLRPPVASLLTAARERCDDLERIISDLLDIGIVESGELAIRLAPTDVAKLVDVVARDARPARGRSALVAFGLPYEKDPAITRHIAAFLARHGIFTGAARVDAVLFNGGVFRARAIGQRLLEVLSSWSGAAVVSLEYTDPDLAVARGAVVYGLALRGRGIRIEGGAARGYYVGLSPEPGKPRHAVCVVPRGAKDGVRYAAPDRTFALAVGRSASVTCCPVPGLNCCISRPPGRAWGRWPA